MNRIQKRQKEIAEMVSVIDDMWILWEMKRFITGMTKDTKYEALVFEKNSDRA